MYDKISEQNVWYIGTNCMIFWIKMYEILDQMYDNIEQKCMIQYRTKLYDISDKNVWYLIISDKYVWYNIGQKCMIFWIKMYEILHQNVWKFWSKCIRFWTKTYGILDENVWNP